MQNVCRTRETSECSIDLVNDSLHREYSFFFCQTPMSRPQVLLPKTILPAGSVTSNLGCDSVTAHLSLFLTGLFITL